MSLADSRTVRLALRLLLPALCSLLSSCARVVAPPPPSSAPDVSDVGHVAGDRVVVAAKAARTLADLTFTTRRFGSDSIWGFRAQDKLAARLRYGRGTADSVRIYMELWGSCAEDRRCNRYDVRAILERIRAEEAAPG